VQASSNTNPCVPTSDSWAGAEDSAAARLHDTIAAQPPVGVQEWRTAPCRTIALADTDLWEVSPAEEGALPQAPGHEPELLPPPRPIPEVGGDDTRVERSPWVLDRPKVRTAVPGRDEKEIAVAATIALGTSDLRELSPSEAALLAQARQHYSKAVLKGPMVAPKTGGQGASAGRSSNQRWRKFLGQQKQGLEQGWKALEALGHERASELPLPLGRALTFVLSSPRLVHHRCRRLLEPGRVAPIWLVTVAFLAGVAMTVLALVILKA